MYNNACKDKGGENHDRAIHIKNDKHLPCSKKRGSRPRQRSALSKQLEPYWINNACIDGMFDRRMYIKTTIPS